jgi:proteasome assembly chaperone (PAC2) family protein
MTDNALNMLSRPKLSQPRLIMGLGGWMDGGDVSTGTIEFMARELSARKIAQIEPDDFYLYNFPGSMEIAAMFRPHVKIEDGQIENYQPIASEFFCDPQHDLILFSGREPNFNWQRYGRCIFDLCQQFEVREIFFIGSVAGAVPHTREPRLSGSVSDADMKPLFRQFNIRPSSYEGPASFITYLTREAASHGRRMASLIAEIPAYVQGPNPRCIESMVRRISAILGMQFSLERLREVSEQFEQKVTEAVANNDELGELIAKLEADYDNEVFDNQMGDLKSWLEKKGIRLD